MSIDSGTITGNDSEKITVTPAKHSWQAHKRRLYVLATGNDDGTGTVTLQRTPDGGANMFDVGTIAKGDTLDFDYLPDEEYHLDVSGGTSPEIDYWVY